MKCVSILAIAVIALIGLSSPAKAGVFGSVEKAAKSAAHYTKAHYGLSYHVAAGTVEFKGKDRWYGDVNVDAFHFGDRVKALGPSFGFDNKRKHHFGLNLATVKVYKNLGVSVDYLRRGSRAKALGGGVSWQF